MSKIQPASLREIILKELDIESIKAEIILNMELEDLQDIENASKIIKTAIDKKVNEMAKLILEKK